MSSGPPLSNANRASLPPAASARAPELTGDECARARDSVWKAPAELANPPGAERVLPQLNAPGIRIECVARRPIETLAERVEVCRKRQREAGRVLASTFCHGGSLFLVFKRWPYSAHPFPRST